MMFVYRSTEQNTKTTLKQSATQSTRMTANITGKARGQPRSGFPSKALASPTRTTLVSTSRSRGRGRGLILNATRFPSSSASMYQRNNAELSRTRSAGMNPTNSVTRCPRRTAILSIRRFPTESANGWPRKFVMKQVLDLVMEMRMRVPAQLLSDRLKPFNLNSFNIKELNTCDTYIVTYFV